MQEEFGINREQERYATCMKNSICSISKGSNINQIPNQKMKMLFNKKKNGSKSQFDKAPWHGNLS
jgi:hypothetical protein